MNHTLEQIPADAARIAQLRHEAGRPGAVEITLGARRSTSTSCAAYADAGWDGRWSSRSDEHQGRHRGHPPLRRRGPARHQ